MTIPKAVKCWAPQSEQALLITPPAPQLKSKVTRCPILDRQACKQYEDLPAQYGHPTPTPIKSKALRHQ